MPQAQKTFRLSRLLSRWLGKPIARAYIHYGRVRWWRILLGIAIIYAALVSMIVIPTHLPLLRASSSPEERDAIRRVIKGAALLEAERIVKNSANAVGVDIEAEMQNAPQSRAPGRRPETALPQVPPAPPVPPVSPGSPTATKAPKPAAKESPTATSATPQITARLVNGRKEYVIVDGNGLNIRATLEEDGGVQVSSIDGAHSISVAPPRTGDEAGVARDPGESGDEEIAKDPGVNWNVDFWGLKFNNVDFETYPAKVPREPLLTAMQQSAVEKATRFDIRKALLGSMALIGLTVLTFFLLLTRAFAGRAARQTQRVRVVEAAARVDTSARLVAEAQLKAMQAQVEPHFLFNTLAHVKALQEIDVDQASAMLDHLILYLRTALPNLREGSSTLGKEFELAQAYLNILKLRMGERLTFSLDLPESLKTQIFPPALIINLVENAIKHGLERARNGGSVRLTAQRIGDSVVVSVADTGRGLDASAPGGTGIGLSSIRNRLALLYGDTARFSIEPNSPSGVIATLAVPAVIPEFAAQPNANRDASIAQSAQNAYGNDVSDCRVNVALVLAFAGGFVGAHNWYLRRKRYAIAQGLVGMIGLSNAIDGDPIVPMLIISGIWLLVDLILIATKSMKDGAGRRVVIDK